MMVCVDLLQFLKGVILSFASAVALKARRRRGLVCTRGRELPRPIKSWISLFLDRRRLVSKPGDMSGVTGGKAQLSSELHMYLLEHDESESDNKFLQRRLGSCINPQVLL